MKAKFLVPLALFILVAGFLGYGLGLNPRELPSALLNKPVPQFERVRLDLPNATFSPADMKGKVWLLNVWATWCVSCREEHPILVELAKNKTVPIVGLNYKEVRGDGSLDADKIAPDAEKKLALERANGWLNEHGNPYVLSALDLDGRVGIDYGVYGVPETYIIDKAGVIRLKHIGPVTPDVYAKKILPLVAELNK